MEKVNGIGGLFFRARDPEALAAWYRDVLGVDGLPTVWQQEAGPTVLSPFPADSDYFAADRQWMINFRVDNLPAMIAQLQAAGIEVITNPDWDQHPEVGTFARIHDPEGNPVELWQPVGAG
ncbi:VOC family protein [Pseudooceanicola sp.]|uniref:VOC family protein n=1 Tax=Pseudooceanicola sp. TaxID=1914328 RepID=UPI0035C6A3FF